MPFKEMTFKGNRVFVEVDDAGNIVGDGSRARMKYRLDDDKIYRPSIGNLEDVGEGPSAKAAPRPSKPKKSPGPGVKATDTAPETIGGIVAYTDGACLGNPGPAGLGYLVRYPDGRLCQAGEPLGSATNNIAELAAISRVLDLTAGVGLPLVVHTDSTYAIGVLTKGWKAKANPELIAAIKRALARRGRVTLKKVKGHAGIEENEIVDQLARIAAQTQETVTSL